MSDFETRDTVMWSSMDGEATFNGVITDIGKNHIAVKGLPAGGEVFLRHSDGHYYPQGLNSNFKRTRLVKTER